MNLNPNCGGEYVSSICVDYERRITRLDLDKIASIELINPTITETRGFLSNLRVRIRTRTGVTVENVWRSFGGVSGYITDDLTGQSTRVKYAAVHNGRVNFYRIRFDNGTAAEDSHDTAAEPVAHSAASFQRDFTITAPNIWAN
jgi:hypothetical protein